MYMIKVMYGKKGTGKTKFLVNSANSLASEKLGDIVFIDSSDQLMYDLKHEIRFINTSEFPRMGMAGFLGFICGIVSEDYDIKGIFIDGLTYIVNNDINSENSYSWTEFFDSLKQLANKYKIDFYISMNCECEAIPEYLQEFVA